MARYKIIYLLLLTYTIYVSAEDAEDRTISLKPPDKLVLQKSVPYQGEPSFFSRLKNWFFPSDAVPSEGQHNVPQYAHPQPYHSRPGCNPCNSAPWIPIASNIGHNTLINFVPPSSHLKQFKLPTEYGPPPSGQYGPPPSAEYGPLPSSQYGPPPSPSSQYGPPPSLSSQYGPPPTASSQYGPPPRPSTQYGSPPGPTSQYGPPPGPSSQYGPPLSPSSQYGPPPSPSSQYGPPPSHDYGPPPEEYGPPPRPQYGPPPSSPSQQYGAPLPRPSKLYGPPPALYVRPPPPSQYNSPVFKPKPNKINFGLPQNLKPPPTVITHLKPVSPTYDVPIGMKPPPLTGSYHSLPPTSPSTNYYLPPPPPPPSDSYGAPVSGANADYQIRPEFVPPLEQLPLPSNPIPLPNLSALPLAPIHGPSNFRDNIPQQGENYEVKASHNVQVVPSVKVADFLASIEHPINIIQSPLVEVAVKNSASSVDEEQSDVRPGGFYENSGKLSENPIVVEDTHAAASAVNVTFHENNSDDLKQSAQTSYHSSDHDILNSNLIKEVLFQHEGSERQNKTFTQPPLDYSKWEPTFGTFISSSVVAPPIGPTTWLQPVSSTTKKPKQIQIIIPYVNSKNPVPFNNPGRMAPSKPYTTLLPVYSPPASTEEVWSKFVDDFNLAESKKVTATAFTPPTTQVYNIRDLLKDTKEFYNSDKLPFDVISLQNNIDDWTQQEYSKPIHRDQKSSTNAKFVPSKKIPDEFFTTLPNIETTTEHFDHEQAGSSKKETKLEDDFETNLIFKETTTEVPTTTQNRSFWDETKVTVSPLTKEKVYIVTPQPHDVKTTTPKTAWSLPPKVQNLNQSVAPTPKFLVRVDPLNNSSRERLKENAGPLTVVFSEWPHLINNLQTTTTLKPSTSKHPLLGLMGLSSYTPPPNATIETIVGHSRVVTVVTPSTVTTRSTKVN